MVRDPARRRGGRPSTYELRRLDLAELFSMTARPPPVDAEARSVLADALEERGLHDLARDLRAWPRSARFYGSLLREKIQRAIYGPQPRHFYSPRKPERWVPLALLPPDVLPDAWLRIDRTYVDEPGGHDFVLFTPVGHDATRSHVRAISADVALEAAEERWPHHFFEEREEYDDDEDEGGASNVRVPREDIYIQRARAFRYGRPVNVNQAFVPDFGVVDIR